MLTCKRGAFILFSGLIPILLPALSKINMTYKSHALLFKQHLRNEATALFLFTSKNEEMHSPEMYFKNEPTSKAFHSRWVFSELFYTHYFVSSSSDYLHSIWFPYIRKFQEILKLLVTPDNFLGFFTFSVFDVVCIFTSGPTEDFCISCWRFLSMVCFFISVDWIDMIRSNPTCFVLI